MIRDRAFMKDLLALATEARSTALIFTVDMPLPGTRYRDYRSGLAGAPGTRGKLRRLIQALTRPAWSWDVGIMGRPHALGNVRPVLGSNSELEDFFAWMRNNFDPTVTWDDLAWVREYWKGPLVIKGVLDSEDARKAVEIRADGIIVSNHGGRQLDGAMSTARALPRIAEVAKGKLPILVDGGVRNGLDIVRMLALGADAAMIGRPWAYALAARGEKGVAHILDLFAAEMRVAMALCGVNRVSDISTDMLADWIDDEK